MKAYTPHPYQSDAIQFVKDRPKSALFLDMGLGKTSITLTAIRDLLAVGGAVRVLVIAPKRVADRTWTDEAAKWSHTTGIQFARIMGTAREREAALNTPAHVFLINRENVPWLVDHLSPVWPFDMVVIDESDSFKSPSSERFKALRRVCRKFARCVILSGTPSPNSYMDLWSQFYLLDKGVLGPTFGSFRTTLFDPDRRGRDRVYTYKLKPGSRELIEEMIRPVTLSLRAADYLKLPPRIDNVVKVAMGAKARSAYDKLEADLVLQLAADGLVTAANAAVLTGKLAQAANGAIYGEDGVAHHLHDEKLEALAEILDTATSNTLVAYAYQHDLARLKARFPDAVQLDEPGAIDRWNRGEIRVLLAHPASAGHGLNLQDGGNSVVWFGLTWSNALTSQFNARLHRQGQTKPVVVTYLASEGTVDEDILEVVGERHDAQELLLNALRRRVQKVTA